MKSKYVTDNVHCALNAKHYFNTHKNPAMILSLDTKKAFDHVKWSFMFLRLEKFGLGSLYRKKSLYRLNSQCQYEWPYV